MRGYVWWGRTDCYTIWRRDFKENRCFEGELKIDKSEIISQMLLFKDKIGIWKIAINEITTADYVIGYGYDDNTKLWRVYQNAERGIANEWMFETEEQAVEKLYKKA